MIKLFETYIDDLLNDQMIDPIRFKPHDVWMDLQTDGERQIFNKHWVINIKNEYVNKMIELLKPGKYIKFTGSSTGEIDDEREVEGYIINVVNVPDIRLDITIRENDKENTYSLYTTKDVELFNVYPPVKVSRNIEKWWELKEK